MRISVLRRVGLGGAAAAIGWLCLGADTASAASGWVPSVDVSAPSTASSYVDTAVDAQGNAIAVWRRGPDGGEATVQSAFRPAGGPWQAPVDISEPGLDGSRSGLFGVSVVGPQVAMDGRGTAMAVWQRSDGISLVVQAAERPAGGSWGTPVDLSRPGGPGDDSGSPSITIDRQGNALAVWNRRDPTTRATRIESAEHPAGARWQPPVAVSAAGDDAVDAHVAIDAQGTAHAAWTRPGKAAQSALRPAGGAWEVPEDIPGTTRAVQGITEAVRDLDFAVDASGEAVAVWTSPGANDDSFGAVRPAGGPWQMPTRLGGDGSLIRAAIDEQGNATAVWLGNDDSVMGAARPSGGDWQPGDVIRASRPYQGPSAITEPSVVADSHGDVTAVWSDLTGARPEIEATRRVGQAWQEPVRLSAAGRSAITPDLAVDPSGNAVAAWGDATAGVISAAGFDATAPEVRGVRVPASGAAGRPVSFAASPFDVWSAPLVVAWTFGDGATATGNTVTHTYAVVGRHVVGVATSDLVGNAVRGTKAIVIKPSVLGLRVSPNAFRRSRPGRVGFRLAFASRVGFVVERVRVGRRVGRVCAAGSRANRRRATCTRYVRVGSFSRSAPSGTTSFKVPTSVAGRRLAPGRYRLSGTPRAAGLKGRPSRAGFHVTG